MSLYFIFSLFGLVVAVAYLGWRLFPPFMQGLDRNELDQEPDSNLTPEKNLLKLVRKVPKGHVVTFGMLSQQMEGGMPPAQIAKHIRELGTGSHLPWWRVVRKEGNRGVIPVTETGVKQRKKLESEGIQFEGETISLKEFEWTY